MYNEFLLIYMRNLILSVCSLFILLAFAFTNVTAADPSTATITYNVLSNSFDVTGIPSGTADVSVFYKDIGNNTDALFGKSDTPLEGKTCSSVDCVSDKITFGIAKIYLEDENIQKIIKFQVIGGFLILNEETIPGEDRMKELSKDEEEWLEKQVALVISPTPTLTVTPSITATVTPAASLFAATPSLTPSPTPADPQLPGQCTNGAGWVNEYIAAGTIPGTQQNGLPVPAYRTNPTYGFNAPDDLFFAPGIGGQVIYKFPGKVNDIHDADGEADIAIYEVTLGRATYPEEKATVQVSQDGVTWFPLSTIASSRASVAGVTLLDIHETGLPWIQYIRLKDMSVYPLSIPEGDGFDINAIGALSQECITPTPTASPTPTSTLTPTVSPTATLTPSPTPAAPVTPLACVEGTGYLTEYVSGTQGKQQNLLPVPAYRSLPSYGFNAPDGVYYTLGLGGTATYKFAGQIQNVAGADFSMYEETLGRMTYPIESTTVQVSQDGVTWFPLSTVATSRAASLGITAVDFNETGLPWIQYVRMQDTTAATPTIFEADGYDLNAIVAVSQTCPADEGTGSLSLRKFNTVSSPVSPGSEVTYVMEVTATDDKVDDVLVLDLPPAGFTYVKGSWTAQSSDTTRGVDGNLKQGGITTEPTYASPGTWKLGNMKAGEKVTLTYKARIDGSTEAGTYSDLAWSEGEGGTVLGVGTSSSFVQDEFVGTEVPVVRDTQTTASINIARTDTRTETVTGDVLGASTLPKTGASQQWIWIAGLLMVIGTGSLFSGYRLLQVHPDRRGRVQRVNRRVSGLGIHRMFYVFILFALVTFFAQTASAAAITTIRISIPNDKINTNNFKIAYAAMDSEGRALTIRCYKKGPSDGGFVMFGSAQAIKPGGNSGFCNVDSSVVGESGKDYQFQASVQPAGGAEIFSQVVGTTFNNQTPGTPVNYSKELAGCTYKIRFRTANDNGKTKKVEIYRSENTSFNVDGGTRVGEVSANSNEDKQFENTPDCGKKYYYVVRAFDEFGNGSGVTGDSEVTVTTSTTTSTTTTTGTGAETGALPAAAGTTVGQPGADIDAPVVTPGANEGAVEGADTNDETDTNNEEILGAQSDKDAENARTTQRYILLGIAGVILLGILIYAILKNKVRRVR